MPIIDPCVQTLSDLMAVQAKVEDHWEARRLVAQYYPDSEEWRQQWLPGIDWDGTGDTTGR